MSEISEKEAERRERQKIERLADDLLRGARAIGDYAGLTEDEVYYAVRVGKLSARRWGRDLIAFKSELNRELRSLAR